MNNKIIIFATTFFLLISFLFLAWSEKEQADINKTNAWSIYFNNPKDRSVDFTIQNNSENTNFTWQVFSDKAKLDEKSVTVKKSESLNIPVSSAETAGKKITIVVTDEKNKKKEIYKSL